MDCQNQTYWSFSWSHPNVWYFFRVAKYKIEHKRPAPIIWLFSTVGAGPPTPAIGISQRPGAIADRCGPMPRPDAREGSAPGSARTAGPLHGRGAGWSGLGASRARLPASKGDRLLPARRAGPLTANQLVSTVGRMATTGGRGLRGPASGQHGRPPAGPAQGGAGLAGGEGVREVVVAAARADLVRRQRLG
jgi:hypothetical protein